MRERRRTRVASLTLAVVVVLTGCATVREWQVRETEHLLTTAGFQMKAADDTGWQPAKPYRVVSHAGEGGREYAYADPGRCQCVYVGGLTEYAQYQRLAREQSGGAWGSWYRPYWW